MRCRESNWLEDYRMDLLEPASRARFERHLSECRSCRQALQDASSAGSLLQWLSPVEPSPAPSPDFYRKVQRSLEQRLAAGWWRPVAALQLRLAYPLLLLGFLLTAWTLVHQADNLEEGVLGLPPSRFASAVLPQESYLASRDLVMNTLVGFPEEELPNE